MYGMSFCVTTAPALVDDIPALHFCVPLLCIKAAHANVVLHLEGRYKATWKREFKLPWRKAGLLK
jgi:hypothetical protein